MNSTALDNHLCIGTQKIPISLDNNDDDIDGMLALLVPHKDSNSSEKLVELVIMITDGKRSYQAAIELSRLKKTTEQIDQNHSNEYYMQWFITLLLQRQESQKDVQELKKNICSFSFDNDQQCIMFTLIYNMNENISRIIYSQPIQPVSMSNSNTALAFIQQISNSLLYSSKRITSLEIERQKLTGERNSWKDTAQKLSTQKWNNERENILDQSMTILNRVKMTVREKQEEIDSEKKRYAELEAKYRRLELVLQKKRKEREAVADYEDEHDQSFFEDEEILALSKGQRLQEPQEAKTFGFDEAKANELEARIEARRREGLKRMKSSSTKSTEAKSSAKVPSKTSTENRSSTALETEKTMGAKKPVMGTEKDQPVSKKRKMAAATSNRPEEKTSSQTENSTRKNAITGSIEIFNLKDFFSDSDSDN